MKFFTKKIAFIVEKALEVYGEFWKTEDGVKGLLIKIIQILLEIFPGGRSLT